MNDRGDESHHVEKRGKPRILEAERPADSLERPRVEFDKFGAVQVLDSPCSSGGSTFTRLNKNTEEVSTGAFRAVNEATRLSLGDRHYTNAKGSADVSTWRKHIDSGQPGITLTLDDRSKRTGDLHSDTSTPRSCTIDEVVSADSRDPPPKRLCVPLEQKIEDSILVSRHRQTQSSQLLLTPPSTRERRPDHTLLPSSQIQQTQHTKNAPLHAPTASVSIEDTILPPGSPPLSQKIEWPSNLPTRPGVPILELNKVPTSSAVGQSGSSRATSQESEFQQAESYNYKFASAGREAYLRERMDDQQRIQVEDFSAHLNAAPVVKTLPTAHGAERSSHVVSPEDLIWGSVKNYCGMVLDKETRVVLGTAVLFVPAEPSRQGAQIRKSGKSAWVTSVNTVEGRRQILIKNCKGEVHEAELLLTSGSFGLAFFSVHTWPGTFALAFLSMMTGPASLPHRAFVDVDRGDRVYVFGYEEPWESEISTIADVRVRPGRITDAGKREIVEIDFTTGQLGGSISTPTGFRGGLIVRADGVFAGVVTGHTMESHNNLIDFSSAYTIYSLLEEL